MIQIRRRRLADRAVRKPAREERPARAPGVPRLAQAERAPVARRLARVELAPVVPRLGAEEPALVVVAVAAEREAAVRTLAAGAGAVPAALAEAESSPTERELPTICRTSQVGRAAS